MAKGAGKKLGRGKLALIIGAAAVVLLVVAALLSGAAARRAAAAAANAAETVTLQKSDLTQSINVSGVVQSAQTTNIYSTLNYPVKEIFVEVGDAVEAGDVIAVLDTANLENDISQAQINYGSAKRNQSDSVTNAQTSLTAARITAEQRAMAAANAEKDLATARADAAKPFDSYTYDRAVNEARITLERKTSDAFTTLSDYNKALFSFDDYKYQNAVTDASIALERKRRALDDADRNDGKSYAAAQNAVDDAQRAYDRAVTDLARAKDDAVKAASDKADAASKALADAQRAYDKAVQDRRRAANDYADNSAKKVESAEKALAEAKKQLESAENSVRSAENALKQSGAGTNVELQGLTLEKLNRQLADGQIVAEAGGIITAVNAKVGATPQGVLFVIDNKDELYVSARVKEYNLNTLSIGQEILITTDATGDKKCSATLSYISPKAVSEAGSTSVEFEVRATLADPDEAIKIGMNAFLNIVLETRENVYAVPVSAVVTDERGSFVYAVPEISFNGRPPRGTANAPARIEIPVALGIKTSTSVEISGGGLKDGLRILTDPENKLSDGQQQGFGMMPFGRGR